MDNTLDAVLDLAGLVNHPSIGDMGDWITSDEQWGLVFALEGAKDSDGYGIQTGWILENHQWILVVWGTLSNRSNDIRTAVIRTNAWDCHEAPFVAQECIRAIALVPLVCKPVLWNTLQSTC